MKKLGFLNPSFKCNLFIYMGLTFLLKSVNACPPGQRKSHSWLGFQRKHEISIILAISVFSKDLDQDKQILKQKQSLCFYPLLESVAKFSILDLVMLVDCWRSDVNNNKEGEPGRSECEVTKTRYLEAEELREIWDLSCKSSFQNKLGHVVCVILTSSLRRFLQTALPLFCGAQFRSIQLFLIAAPFSWLPHCGQPFSLFHSFCCCCCSSSSSLRQVLQAAYKMISSPLLFQN